MIHFIHNCNYKSSYVTKYRAILKTIAVNLETLTDNSLLSVLRIIFIPGFNKILRQNKPTCIRTALLYPSRDKKLMVVSMATAWTLHASQRKCLH